MPNCHAEYSNLEDIYKYILLFDNSHLTGYKDFVFYSTAENAYISACDGSVMDSLSDGILYA